MDIVLTIVIGAAGFFIAHKLKLPAAAMIGALFAIGIFNVITGMAYIPAFLKTATQILAGAFIGTKITRDNVNQLKKAIKPALINCISIVIFGLILGLIIYFITDYDLVTTTFASAPGGLVDMSLIAIDLGADMSLISVLQLVRLLSILGLFPYIINFILKRAGKKSKEASEEAHELEEELEKLEEEETQHEVKLSTKQMLKRTSLTIVIAAAFGLLGKVVGIPAGALIFSMVAVAAQNLISQSAYVPFELKQGAQMFAGILIGQTITLSAILCLRYAIVPAIIILFGYILTTIIIGLIVHKTTGLDLPTSLFACAPGGATDISLMSEDFGAHAPTVTIIQFPRVIAVILLYPPAILILNSLIG